MEERLIEAAVGGAIVGGFWALIFAIFGAIRDRVKK